MSADIPQWAKERAIALANAEFPHSLSMSSIDGPGKLGSAVALARYIAEHEQPPVDPQRMLVEELTRDIYGNGFRWSLKSGVAARQAIAETIFTELAQRGLKIVEAE